MKVAKFGEDFGGAPGGVPDAQNEGAHTVLDHQGHQGIDVDRLALGQDHCTTHLPRIAASLDRCAVEKRAELGESLGADLAEVDHPPVSDPTGAGSSVGLGSGQPEWDLTLQGRTALGACEMVVTPGLAGRIAVGRVQQGADDSDGLLGRVAVDLAVAVAVAVAPEPSPSTARPPERSWRLAQDRATIDAGRAVLSSRVAATCTVVVRAAVQAARLNGSAPPSAIWSGMATRS